jgi:hypothetical protein
MSGHDEDLDDEGWEVRETFAYFGRAYYMASVLEVGLAHSLMWGEFMTQEAEKIKATKGKGFDRKRYEADFDAFMDKQFAQTMGAVIQRATMLPAFTDELKERIEAARKRRNFLAHDYWREMSERFATSKGREGMREELLADAETFGQLDRDIDAAMIVIRQELGVDDKMLDDYSEAMMERI